MKTHFTVRILLSMLEMFETFGGIILDEKQGLVTEYSELVLVKEATKKAAHNIFKSELRENLRKMTANNYEYQYENCRYEKTFVNVYVY